MLHITKAAKKIKVALMLMAPLANAMQRNIGLFTYRGFSLTSALSILSPLVSSTSIRIMRWHFAVMPSQG